jgi:hypothetical protein
MLTSAYRRLFGFMAMVAMAAFMSAAPAAAQTSTNQQVQQFLANPSQVLQQYQNGGAQLISLVRDVATSHPEALATIMSLIASANPDQQAAIGSGLGQAAQIVARTNPDYAAQIQQAVAASGNNTVQTAYAGATGNTVIGAAGGGGGGAAGGGGGGIGGPTNFAGFAFGGTNGGSGPNGAQHFQTPTQNYFTGGSAGGASSSGGSVSPTR